MKDGLHEYASRELYTPLRKCEWCNSAAERGRDLCGLCEESWLEKLVVPFESGECAECVFGLARAAGMLW